MNVLINIWIHEENPQAHAIRLRCQEIFSEYCSPVGFGYAGQWLNLFAIGSESYFSFFEEKGKQYGFRVSKGSETPDFVTSTETRE